MLRSVRERSPESVVSELVGAISKPEWCLIGRVPRNAAVTNLLPPYVLRLDHAQPPSTSAPKVGACRFLRPRWTCYHPTSPAATAPKVCSIVVVCVSILAFASACAVVLLPSIFPPHEILSCWCVRIMAPERLCQIIRRLAVPFLSGLNSRNVQGVRRIVTTATRNLKARHEILERISDRGRYAALPRILSGTGARRPETPSQLLDAGQPGIANRTRAELTRQ